VNRLIGAVLALVPEQLDMRMNPAKYGFRPADIPEPPRVPSTDVRLYVAPVNFAGQGHAWARSAELLPGVGAVSMQYVGAANLGFPIDNAVPVAVFSKSRSWQRAQFTTVSRFTHVLIEAERSIFGALFDTSQVREVAELRRHGLAVAMVSHGSDLRLPSRHRELDEWSPFHDTDWDLIPVLEEQSLRHRALLAELDAPVFVSTPDLLLDWPGATWLPVVVDPELWAGGATPLVRAVPVVVHAPSNPRIKGSALIDPVLRDLAERGLIEYRRIEGVPSGEMPDLYRDADIVLEQFRIGTYSRAAVEAMVAGRIVLGHVHEQVRDHVRAETGEELPVVEATPATLSDVLTDILDRRAHYQALAIRGAAFGRRVHDGRASAQALSGFLGAHHPARAVEASL
jgi:hypothetical protein